MHSPAPSPVNHPAESGGVCHNNTPPERRAMRAMPQGTFLNDTLQQQKTIVNCMAINQDNVMVTGGDNGSLWCERCCHTLAPDA